MHASHRKHVCQYGVVHEQCRCPEGAQNVITVVCDRGDIHQFLEREGDETESEVPHQANRPKPTINKHDFDVLVAGAMAKVGMAFGQRLAYGPGISDSLWKDLNGLTLSFEDPRVGG